MLKESHVHVARAKQQSPDRLAPLLDYAGRGVVTTSTYEARSLGVFSAMDMMQAAKLAPRAALLLG